MRVLFLILLLAGCICHANYDIPATLAVELADKFDCHEPEAISSDLKAAAAALDFCGDYDPNASRKYGHNHETKAEAIFCEDVWSFFRRTYPTDLPPHWRCAKTDITDRYIKSICLKHFK